LSPSDRKDGEKNTTISQLRALLSKPGTEKTSKVLEQAGIKAPAEKQSALRTRRVRRSRATVETAPKRMAGLARIKIAHASLKPGDGWSGVPEG